MINYLGVRKIVADKTTFLVTLSLISIILECCAFIVNDRYFAYQGVFYNPARLLTFCSTISLIILGVRYTLNMPTEVFTYIRCLAWLYSVFLIITLATNAAQLTPFPPIDASIVAFESYFGINLLDIVIWANAHPLLGSVLRFAYATLNYQIAILPIIAIFLGLREELHAYFVLMLLTMLLGFSFYYFFPTTAPASVFAQEHFRDAQIATGLKFWQIHQHIAPETSNGGLIALPSFHVIWAWLGTYMLRKQRFIMFFLVPLNILLVISCVLLGWHYITDLVGSVLVLVVAHAILIMHRSATKWRESGGEDHASIEKIGV